jgi:hypothetical protein
MDKETNISSGEVTAGRDISAEGSTVAGRDVSQGARQQIEIDAHFHAPRMDPPVGERSRDDEELPGTGPLDEAQSVIDELLSLNRNGGLNLDEYLRLRRQHSRHRRLISDAMLIEVARRQHQIEHRLNCLLRTVMVLFGLSPVVFIVIAVITHSVLTK